MLNTIISGVVGELRKEFPAVERVYTEQVKQGFAEPCFMVSCISINGGHHIENRYLFDYVIAVQYAPQSKTDAKSECNAVAMRLYECLELIDAAGTLLRGRRKQAEFSGGVLTFTLYYTAAALKEGDEPVLLEELEHETELKDG